VTDPLQPMSEVPGPVPAAAPPRPSLRRNFVWAFLGDTAYMLSGYGVLILLAKLGSVRFQGQYILAVSISAPVVIFATLQLRQLLATDVNEEHAFGLYLAVRLVAMPLAVGVVAAVGFSLYRGSLAVVIALVAIYQAVAGIRDVFFGVMQKHERMSYISVGKTVAAVAALGAMAAALWLTGSLLVGLGLAVGVRVAMLVVYDRPMAGRLVRSAGGSAGPLRPRFEVRPMLRLMWQALPLGIVMMIISLEVYCPNYFVKRFGGVEMVGYFGSIALLLQGGRCVIGALGQSAAPRLAQYYHHDLPRLGRLLGRLTVVALAIGGAGVLVAGVVGGWVLRLLYTPQHAAYGHVFVLVMVAGLVSYVSSFLGYFLTAARYLVIQLPINLAVLAVTVTGSLLLIRQWGLVGAAVTLILAAVTQLVLQAAAAVHAIFRQAARLRAAAGEVSQTPTEESAP